MISIMKMVTVDYCDNIELCTHTNLMIIIVYCYVLFTGLVSHTSHILGDVPEEVEPPFQA